MQRVSRTLGALVVLLGGVGVVTGASLFAEAIAPPQRWQVMLRKEVLSKRFPDLSKIRRSQILPLLGEPDEGSVAKQFDLWGDDRLIRRHLTVVYDTGDSSAGNDPGVAAIVYQSSIIWLDRKFTLSTEVLRLRAN